MKGCGWSYLHLLNEHHEVKDSLFTRDAREAAHVRHHEAAVVTVARLNVLSNQMLLGVVGVPPVAERSAEVT